MTRPVLENDVLYMLTEVPSRERLFDVLRLRPNYPDTNWIVEVRIAHFLENASKDIGPAELEVEGIHFLGGEPERWIIFGRTYMDTARERFVHKPLQGNGFFLSAMDTRRRKGNIIFGPHPFLSDEVLQLVLNPK